MDDAQGDWKMAQREVSLLRRFIRESLDDRMTWSGWWITPSGELVEVPGNMEHPEKARELMGREDDDSEVTDLDDLYMLAGAVKLREFERGVVTICTRRWTKQNIRRIQGTLVKLKYPPRTLVRMIQDPYPPVMEVTVFKLMSVDDPRDL